jgi:hypothetical protein
MMYIKNDESAQFTIVKKYHRQILWIILSVLFALDILTTTISLALGNFEKNPLMIPFANNPVLHGIIKIIAFIFLFVVVERAVMFINTKRPEKKPFWVKLNFKTLYALIIFTLLYIIWLYFYVVVSNLLIIS